MCGCKTWVLTAVDKLELSTFERKILQKIYGPVCERGEWQIRYNHELHQLYYTILSELSKSKGCNG
jgi:hypothetical protein